MSHYDDDEILASLKEEMQILIGTLNTCHHPVYPAPANRVKELEAQLAELRSQISARRQELRDAKAA